MTTQELKDLFSIDELPSNVDESILEQMPDRIQVKYVHYNL
jgi:hypothetical protein